MPTTNESTGLDRRTFLVGAAATGLLAACGGTSGTDALEFGTYSTVQRFPADGFTPGELRLPFALADSTANFVSDGPAELSARITDLDGNAIGEPFVAARRDTSPSSYYAFRTTIDTPGFYSIVVEGGPETGTAFEVRTPDLVSAPSAGQMLAGFDTPTSNDPRGVDPICTRDPFCDFHSMTLTEALTDGKSVAYFVGTPAFCQFGTCTPALEALVEAAPDYTETLQVIHAEVYADTTATTIAPAVQALGISYEPTLVIADPEGRVIERIDVLFNAEELRERLDVLLA